MSALIGALRVSLSADTANFEAGMRRAQRQAQSSAGAIQKSMGLIKAGLAGLVSGLSVGLFVNAIKGALDYAGSLGEISQQLGVTTRDLQVFRYAAGQVGVSQKELETGLDRLTRTMGQLAAGAKAPRAALEAVRKGLADQVLAAKDTGEAFRLIADGLQQIPDRAQRAAVEVALFGRSGAKLDTLLSGGSEAINELSLAAEKLGIVLSDQQIQKADETADKLDALKTVISARIAGAVADNADAILGLANALADLVGSIGDALRAWNNFRANINSGLLELQGMEQAAARARGSAFVSGQNPTVPGRSVTIKLGAARTPPAPRPTGNSIGKFLQGGGGGGRKRSGGGRAKEDHSAERALSDAFRFDQDIRRAQQDVLQAMRDLSTDAIERYAISVQIKDAEKAALDAELEYQKKLYKLTEGEQGLSEAQAAQLKIQYDIRDDLERKKMIAEENQRAFEESARLDDLNFELQRDKLESEEQLAETASEQREIQLKLLDLAYRQEQARLDTILADESSSESAKEEARRRKAALNQTYGNDRQAVMNGTRGPWEQYVSELPTTTEKWNEALEEVAANGLKSVEDGLVDVLMGTKSVGDALRDVVRGLLSDLLRLGIRRALGSIIMGGFSEGGYTGNVGVNAPAGIVHGQEFVINAKQTKRYFPLLQAINQGTAPGLMKGGFAGLPIPRLPSPNMASAMEDADFGGGVSMTNHFSFSGPVSRETIGQMESAMRRAVGNATRR